MQRLNSQTYLQGSALTSEADLAPYDRSLLSPGVMHFGVGNFHRCHQAVYFHRLLNLGYRDWGIVGVSLRSSSIRDQLAPQDYLYTEVTLARETKLRIVGSILKILVAPEDPTAVIEQIGNGDTKLVTSTITEKGYCLVEGSLNTEHPDIKADLASLDSPTTIYGYLAAGIIRRREKSGEALSVLCCDNVQNGGDHLANGVHYLLRQHDAGCLPWAKANVSFASSMVDRVAPATADDLTKKVSSLLNLEDAWPVSAEPFSQWVIEDNFSAQRPPLERVGVIFTADVGQFEQMKLRFLNAGHTIISVLGYLAGVESVHEALQRPEFLRFTESALRENVQAVSPVPQEVEAEQYVTDVLARFQNAALPYAVQQVNTDSSQKIQLRWFPTIDDALEQGRDTGFLSFSLAAWLVYVERAVAADELNDPLLPQFSEALSSGSDTQSKFLHIAGAKRFRFLEHDAFMTTVSEHYDKLRQTDIISAVTAFLSAREEQPHA